MTQSSLEIRKNRRIRSAAQEYRDRGYEVIVQPGKTDLPDFLVEFTPDLYARNGEDHVIVEMKTRTSLPKSKDLPRLAEILHDRPGWRLELIVTNSKRDRAKVEATFQLLDKDEVEERFRQVEALLEQKQFAFAMLLAWTATEAALRQIAQYNGVGLADQSPAYIVKQLFSVGILDRNQYNILNDAVQSRNTIVHGFKMSPIQPQAVRNLVDTARDLLQLRSLQHV